MADNVSTTTVQASQRAGGLKIGAVVRVSGAGAASAITNATGSANAANTTDHTAVINSIIAALVAVGIVTN